MKYFISDTHFGHRNIIEFCNRPYSNVDEMDAAIIKAWSVAKPEDTVYFLGDFGINKTTVLNVDLLRCLPGKKILILGNHDYGFARMQQGGKECAQIYEQLRAAGWSEVFTELTVPLKNNKFVNLSHLPPSNEYDSRYGQYKMPYEEDSIYLHGHLHGRYAKKGNLIDVGFDVGLKLISEDEIVNLIEDQRHTIPARDTLQYEDDIHHSLNGYVNEHKLGYVSKKEDGPLVLFDYNDKCTFEKRWNTWTSQARGIIFEKKTGKLIAKTPEKFFNLFENGKTVADLPNEPYIVTEKLDGSMIAIWNYDGKWRTSTRGSFSSDQAKWAQEYLGFYDMEYVKPETTIICEAIYPDNKIVVDYGGVEKLVILTAYDRNTGKELEYKELNSLSLLTGMERVRRYDYTIEDMIKLQKTLPKDDEGFVVRFAGGHRVKIKGEEYMRVHRMISHLTPLTFWENMKNGVVDTSHLIGLPEEFRTEVDELVKTLEQRYKDVEVEIEAEMNLAIQRWPIGDKDEFCRNLGKHKKDFRHSSALFAILRGNSDSKSKYIMRLIRPHFNIL